MDGDGIRPEAEGLPANRWTLLDDSNNKPPYGPRPGDGPEDGSGDESQGLTHLDEQGRARMVDVGAKPETERLAVARGRVTMRPETARLIRSGSVPKGDVLAVARVAAIMGAKRTSDLVPLCHSLRLTAVDADLTVAADDSAVEVEVRVRTRDRTGVEMEALTGVLAAALAVYDMCKAVDRTMTIDDARLVLKRGGRSGEFRREGEEIDV